MGLVFQEKTWEEAGSWDSWGQGSELVLGECVQEWAAARGNQVHFMGNGQEKSMPGG